MSHSDRPQRDSMLEEYLDGLLGDADREAFEERVQADSELRRAVQQQRRVDASLDRLFAVPAAERLTHKLDHEVEARQRRKVPGRADAGRRRVLAVAASIAIAGLAGWRLWSFFAPKRDIYAPQPWRSLQTVYNDVVAGGFKPDWVCKDEQEFVSSFRRRLRAPLLVAQAPSVHAGGLGYCNCITPNTMYVLARVAPNGKLAEIDPDKAAKVIVFVDRASKDTNQTLPPDSSLNKFKKTIGPFVLYEVTPLSKPYVLDLFHQPD